MEKILIIPASIIALFIVLHFFIIYHRVKRMEDAITVTVVDVATPEELKEFLAEFHLFAEDWGKEQITDYKEECLKNRNYNFSELAIYYAFRGEEKKSNKYLDKIRDSEYHMHASRTIIEILNPEEFIYGF